MVGSPQPQRSTDAQNSSARLAGPPYDIRTDALHEMRGGLDEERSERNQDHRLPAGPRAGTQHDDGLRPLRIEDGGQATIRSNGEKRHPEVAPAPSLADEIANVKDYYAACIAELQNTLSGEELAAAIQALKEEEEQAIRVLIEEWKAHFQNRKQPREQHPERVSDPRPLLHLPAIRRS